jgi:hypothetical protein
MVSNSKELTWRRVVERKRKSHPAGVAGWLYSIAACQIRSTLKAGWSPGLS